MFAMPFTLSDRIPLTRLWGAIAIAIVIAIVSQVTFASAPAFATAHSGTGRAALGSLVLNRMNAIRASFGLPKGQPTSAYGSEALQDVRSNTDPSFAPIARGVVAEYSLSGVLPALSAANPPPPGTVVDDWVYRDGWEGSSQATLNAECTSAQAPGCNGHRQAVLSRPPISGAKLYIDITARSVTYGGGPALAVAVLMVWSTSNP
jgi:hypothetical protein